MLTALLDLLVPHRCVACSARSQPPWCVACERVAGASELDQATCCERCAGPVGSHACWEPAPPVRRLWALYRYRGPVADAVVAGKARGVHAVWDDLGARLAAVVDPTDSDVVTWVPAPARRRRRRGFDHAQLLATALARSLGSTAVALLHAPAGLPDRGQADAPRRQPLPTDAYVARYDLSGARVLLVDDVVTTGETLRTAATALRAAGAAVPDAAVVARAGAHPLTGASPERPPAPSTTGPSG